MTDYRYSAHAQQLNDELIAELSAHRSERETLAEEKQASHEVATKGGLEAIAKGTPLDVVKAVIEKKKRPVDQVLKEHEVGKKMASKLPGGSAHAPTVALDALLSMGVNPGIKG